MGTFKDLSVFQKAYQLALDIYFLTKTFPEEEKFGIISQIRRSSRSVCSNFVEAYRRRNYTKHFVSKLSDCLSENSETGLWLDFSKDMELLKYDQHRDFKTRNEEIGRFLNFMINNPERFIWKEKK